MGLITKPNTFAPNTTALSSEVNDNFDTLYNEINGNISAANLATDAVTTAKIQDDAVTAAKIADGTITPTNMTTATKQGWYDLGDTPDTVTYNGNRSYDLVFNGADHTDDVSPGMRLKCTRTVTAPTQCTDLESGSSQYYSKSSPAGLSFTVTWTAMAWVKLESYTLGGIIARRNADTEGWNLAVNASGQLVATSLRIAGNNSDTVSYQSLPLNKWVHVAAATDLAGTTLMYIDGVLVPSATTVTGTAATLVQGTTALVIGARKSAGTDPFDGKIAQAAVFSSKLSAATIASYASQGLSGSETNLVSAYSFNNSITDLNTSNANDLTAQGSAVATATDSPFADRGNVPSSITSGTVEYAIVTKAAFSTNTTLTVQVPEGCALPTSGGISAVSYSTQDCPYGFVRDKGRWTVETHCIFLGIQNSPTISQWYNLTPTSGTSGGHVLTLPIGAWNCGYEAIIATSGGAGGGTCYITLSTANNTETSLRYSTRAYTGSASTLSLWTANRQFGITASSATPYYLNVKADLSVGDIRIYGSNGTTVIYAELAYL